jgi:FlaA1/EpsC-like NDP-sugar epimerase
VVTETPLVSADSSAPATGRDVPLTTHDQGVGGWRRYVVLLLVDAVLTTVAFLFAFLLRFEGHIPPLHLAQFWSSLPWLLAIRLPLNFGLGVHRWSFRLSGLHEAGRLVLSTVTGSAVFVSVFYFLQKLAEDVSLGPPRSVIVIELLLVTAFMGALRFSPRLALAWLNERRIAGTAETLRTIIVGAGNAGELLLRDLRRSDAHPYLVVGFVDDDPARRACSIGGRPVLGGTAELPRLAARHEVRQLLFAVPGAPAELIRRVLGLCAELKLGYKTLPPASAHPGGGAGASVLQSLAPEDLLPRRAAHFDPHEVRALVAGRRILVTGAAGSIGSEICRQVALAGPAHLVLSDLNENELYLLYRDLKRERPELSLAVEVADIRDEERLRQLGLRERPQDVFHAAAHKHVPLMEWTPEEAVKNNVVGCRNVIDVSEECGAERFVLVSSDKAVSPSSVMGATKWIGEELVRSRAATSSVKLTAVRFGNVLGSSGSVVPLFKSQIARGGPVTVTHPDCRRFLMTTSEAVGLVILAGLSHYGELCILEMGEPMRILDLARLMITMAGRVPGQDVEIVTIGLRPGEKLVEQLMTPEEEARSYLMRESIRVVRSRPASADFDSRIEALAELARTGDRAALLAALAEVVPGYRPAAASVRAAEEARGGVARSRRGSGTSSTPATVHRA